MFKKKTPPGPAALAAANWWAEQVGAPVFKMNSTDEPIEDQRRGDMAGMLAMMVADHHPVTAGQGEKFVAALAPAIQSALDGAGYVPSLSVDYGPCRTLVEAATEAGINASRFPWKTTMWIGADHVTASLGYQAPSRLVWASAEWQADRPACGSQRWDRDVQSSDYHGEPFICSLPVYHEDRECRYDQPISLCRTCGRRETSYGHTDEGWGELHSFDALPAGERGSVAPDGGLTP